MDGAEPFAEALASWANENPRVKRFFEEKVEDIAVLNVLLTGAAMVAPIIAAHNPMAGRAARRGHAHGEADYARQMDEAAREAQEDAEYDLIAAEMEDDLRGIAGTDSPIEPADNDRPEPNPSSISGFPVVEQTWS